MLSSYDTRSKVSLDGLARFLGLAGKPNGVDGSKVADLVKQGRVQDVADYCETDVVNTYRVWLRYELFRGGLSPTQFGESEDNLLRFISSKVVERPYLAGLIDRRSDIPVQDTAVAATEASTAPFLGRALHT